MVEIEADVVDSKVVVSGVVAVEVHGVVMNRADVSGLVMRTGDEPVGRSFTSCLELSGMSK